VIRRVSRPPHSVYPAREKARLRGRILRVDVTRALLSGVFRGYREFTPGALRSAMPGLHAVFGLVWTFADHRHVDDAGTSPDATEPEGFADASSCTQLRKLTASNIHGRRRRAPESSSKLAGDRPALAAAHRCVPGDFVWRERGCSDMSPPR
jgi:hypothetical protein